MVDTVNNSIPLVPENTTDPAAGLNLSLQAIDSAVQPVVIAVGDNAPPVSPSDGDRYIVGTLPTGDWATKENLLATYRADGGYWDFQTAKLAFNLDDSNWYYFDGSDWFVRAGGGAGGFSSEVQYNYWTSNSDTPPVGRIHQNADPATVLFFNQIDADGVDRSTLFDTLVVDDSILFQQLDDATTRGTVKVTGDIFQIDDVFHVPVVVVDVSETSLSNNSDVLFVISRDAAGSELDIATADDYRANVPGKLLSTDQVWAAFAEAGLIDAAGIAIDLSTGFDFSVTLAGNRTLNNPTGAQPGQRGRVRIIQDATGTRTLSFGSNYVFAGGVAPVMTATGGAEDILFYDVINPNKILITVAQDVK